MLQFDIRVTVREVDSHYLDGPFEEFDWTLDEARKIEADIVGNIEMLLIRLRPDKTPKSSLTRTDRSFELSVASVDRVR